MNYGPRTGLQRPRRYVRLVVGVTDEQLAKINKHPHGHTMQAPDGRWFCKFRAHGALPNQVTIVEDGSFTQEEAAALWSVESPTP